MHSHAEPHSYLGASDPRPGAIWRPFWSHSPPPWMEQQQLCGSALLRAPVCASPRPRGVYPQMEGWKRFVYQRMRRGAGRAVRFPLRRLALHTTHHMDLPTTHRIHYCTTPPTHTRVPTLMCGIQCSIEPLGDGRGEVGTGGQERASMHGNEAHMCTPYRPTSCVCCRSCVLVAQAQRPRQSSRSPLWRWGSPSMPSGAPTCGPDAVPSPLRFHVSPFRSCVRVREALVLVGRNE